MEIEDVHVLVWQLSDLVKCTVSIQKWIMTGWINNYPVCHELLTLSERKKERKKKKTWGGTDGLSLSVEHYHLSHNNYNMIFYSQFEKCQNKILNYISEMFFIKTDWYYLIDFTTVSWTRTLRGQRHNAHEKREHEHCSRSKWTKRM